LRAFFPERGANPLWKMTDGLLSFGRCGRLFDIFRAAWDCLEEGMNQPYRSSATIGIGQFS
jgi:hypothetical protein